MMFFCFFVFLAPAFCTFYWEHEPYLTPPQVLVQVFFSFFFSPIKPLILQHFFILKAVDRLLRWRKLSRLSLATDLGAVFFWTKCRSASQLAAIWAIAKSPHKIAAQAVRIFFWFPIVKRC